MNEYITNKGIFHIGRLVFTKLPKGNLPYYRGDDFRLGWMVGNVLFQYKQWVIWWRTY